MSITSWCADLKALADSLATVPPHELRQMIAVAEAEFERPAGDLARSALKRILRAYPAQDMDDPRASWRT
jgi:hypothetical protein